VLGIGNMTVHGTSTSIAWLQLDSMPLRVAWTEPDRTVNIGYPVGTVSSHSAEAYRQIGHSMFTLLVAVMDEAFPRHRCRFGVVDEQVSESTS
jgi:hypothetical protein